MTQLLSIVVGAVVALGGGVATTLLAPWVARRWTRADRADQEAKEHHAALRTAVEDYLTAAWDLAAEYVHDLVTNHADQARRIIEAIALVQRREARVGLLLDAGDVEIQDLMAEITTLIVNRERTEQPGVRARPMGALRKEVVRLFGAWLRGSSTPAEVLAEFHEFIAVEWDGPSVRTPEPEQASE